jgi:hypothetical protein
VNEIADWATAYHAAIEEYNSSGFTQSALATFKDSLNRITAKAFANLLANLSAEDWMLLQADYQKAKRGMKMTDDENISPTQQMGVSEVLSSTDTWVLVSQNPVHIKVSYVRSISGESSTTAPGVYHNTSVTTTIGNHTAYASSGSVPPLQYVDEAASITLDNLVDSCFIGGYCNERTNNVVYCTMALANIFAVLLTAQVEPAATDVAWPGTPAPTCPPNAPCQYKTVWHCDAAHTPPDYDVIGINGGDYRKIATYVVWRAISPCIRFAWPEPWTCHNPIPINSWWLSVNDPNYPLYGCTHNP